MAPRSGSDIYTIPPGTEGFPDTTIESEKYNNYIHDVETDLNTPRPISVGGTGANDADEALANLGAEKSSQKVVNYDSHVFLPGSFYSDIAATAAPVAGHAFVGWAVSSDVPAIPPANQNVVIHARDQTDITVVPGRLWVRQKKTGVWGPWSLDATGVAGSTPPVSPPDNTLWWNVEDGQLYTYYRDVDSAQWVIASPSPDPAQFLRKSGDTMTGNLALAVQPVAAMDAANKSYVDTGDGNALAAANAAAAAATAAAVAADAAAATANTKVSKTGDTMTGRLTVSGGGIGITAGGLSVNGGLVVDVSGINSAGGISTASAASATYFSAATYYLQGGVNGGFACKTGDANNLTGNYFNFGWFGGNITAYIDNTFVGGLQIISDYRVKKDVIPLPDMWETVKALRPIKYTQANFTPESEADKYTSGEYFILADEIERWGFIAHELQATLTPSAATGEKDMPNGIQSPNPWTVIAALTKALQDAQIRIEALEAKV